MQPTEALATSRCSAAVSFAFAQPEGGGGGGGEGGPQRSAQSATQAMAAEGGSVGHETRQCAQPSLGQGEEGSAKASEGAALTNVLAAGKNSSRIVVQALRSIAGRDAERVL